MKILYDFKGEAFTRIENCFSIYQFYLLHYFEIKETASEAVFSYVSIKLKFGKS